MCWELKCIRILFFLSFSGAGAFQEIRASPTSCVNGVIGEGAYLEARHIFRLDRPGCCVPTACLRLALTAEIPRLVQDEDFLLLLFKKRIETAQHRAVYWKAVKGKQVCVGSSRMSVGSDV